MRTIPTLVAARKQEILRAFVARAERSSVARGKREPELGALVPEWLELLSREGRLRRAVAWPSTRDGVDLGEAVLEVGLLRRAVVEVVREVTPAERPSRAELERFSRRLEHLASELGERFQREHALASARELDFARALDGLCELASKAPTLPEPTVNHALSVVLDRLAVWAEVGGVGARFIERASSSRCFEVGPLDDGASERGGATVAANEGLEEALGHRSYLEGSLIFHARGGASAASRAVLKRGGARLLARLDEVMRLRDLDARLVRLRAERLHKLRSAAVLAHDLRGPLTTIRIGSDLLLSDEQAARRADVLERTRRSLARMDGMLREFLDASSTDGHERWAVGPVECDLCVIARDVVEELSMNDSVRLELDAGSAVVGAWRVEEIRRALWNLVVNALRYGAPGTTVQVRVSCEEQGARLSVENESSADASSDGVEDDRREERMGAERFVGGWGLGLAMVRTCAEAHGGRLEVENGTSRRTVYSLVLPWSPAGHDHGETPVRAV